MSWRDQLRRVDFNGRKLIGASFRGVPFFVETSERTGGRRTTTHEFPGREDPFIEDLGRRAHRFRLEGYVVGADYIAQKNRLIAALEDEAGPGELVHPYHGVLRAVCDSCAVRESRADGGMATFSIDFAEAPLQAVAPTVQVDTAAAVGTSASAARAATRADLVARYDVAGLPSFALASAERAISGAAKALADAFGPVTSTAQELATLNVQTTLLTTRAASLVRAPADLFDGFVEACASMQATAEAAPAAVMAAFLEAYGAPLGELVRPTSAARAREATNQAALTGALRGVVIIEAARLAPRVAYASLEEAIAARDRIAAGLTAQVATAGDGAFRALVDLRASVLRAVPGGAALARVVEIQRATATPALVLAYQLYGSTAREGDIIARNNIAHPGFVAGTLKVLSDE